MYESLRGATAILTRAPGDDGSLAEHLREAGAAVIVMPCVRTEPLEDLRELTSAMGACDSADWLVVTSRAGADAVARAGSPRCRVAAVGASTAARLEERGIAVAFVPSAPIGERLARELPQAAGALLARSDRALPDLPAILRERGFVVREVVAYRTVAGARGDVTGARDALSSSARVAIFCSSPSALDGLCGAIDAALLRRATFFVFGPTTRRAVRERVGETVRIEPMEEEVMHATHR